MLEGHKGHNKNRLDGNFSRKAWVTPWWQEPRFTAETTSSEPLPPSLISSLLSWFILHCCQYYTWIWVHGTKWLINNSKEFGRKRFCDNRSIFPTPLWREWGKSWKTSVRISGLSVEIRTKHLPAKRTCSIETLFWIIDVCVVTCEHVTSVSCNLSLGNDDWTQGNFSMQPCL
jgi:hypothetical protein